MECHVYFPDYFLLECERGTFMPPQGLFQGFALIAGIVVIAFIFILIASVFIVVWVIRIGRKGRTMAIDLYRNGQRITATVTNIYQESKHVAGKAFPETVYYVTATATDPRTGQPLTLYNQRRILPASRIGDPIIVIIDPNDPSRYLFPN